jgi:large subunit ribosomal protein L10
MPTLLAKASSEAFAVAMEAAIMTCDTIPQFIGRAHRGALGLAGNLSAEALDEELSLLLGAAADAVASAADSASSATEAPTEAEEEEEEEEEEGSFDGLGSLFG